MDDLRQVRSRYRYKGDKDKSVYHASSPARKNLELNSIQMTPSYSNTNATPLGGNLTKTTMFKSTHISKDTFGP